MRDEIVTRLEKLTKNKVYTARAGIVKGLKRRGGLGFIPKWSRLPVDERFLQDLSLHGQVVYDVGGFVGLMTIFFARAVGPTGKVVTFEPNPKNYSRADDHVTLNGFNNVTLIDKGVGEKAEALTFVASDTFPARGSAAPRLQKQHQNQAGSTTFTIDVDTLDNHIVTYHLPPPDFIKIDVEGLELAVLHGMVQTINQHKPKLFIELHGVTNETVAVTLLEHGYQVYQVRDGIDITHENLHQARRFLYAH